MKIRREPTSPGKILSEEFLKPLGMTQAELTDYSRFVNPVVAECAMGMPNDFALR